MNAIKRKAKAGVTLVELLVVILIITILAVGMLPFLKPFVVQAQYSADAIPVIGSIRTKIGLYQYDKGNLPTVYSTDGSTSFSNPVIETWGFGDGGANGGSIQAAPSDTYIPGTRALTTGASSSDLLATAFNPGSADAKAFFGFATDTDNQDLVGKRCKPVHFQYVVVKNGSSYFYVLGCFGDDHGLPQGTGYAVCEVSVKANDGNVYKQVGTWSRYKAATEVGQLTFGTITGASTQPDVDKRTSEFCPIPDATTYFPQSGATATSGKLDLVADLESYGWEF